MVGKHLPSEVDVDGFTSKVRQPGLHKHVPPVVDGDARRGLAQECGAGGRGSALDEGARDLVARVDAGYLGRMALNVIDAVPFVVAVPR